MKNITFNMYTQYRKERIVKNVTLFNNNDNSAIHIKRHIFFQPWLSFLRQ